MLKFQHFFVFSTLFHFLFAVSHVNADLSPCPTLSFFENVNVICVSYPEVERDKYHLKIRAKSMKDYELVDNTDDYFVEIYFDTPNNDFIIVQEPSKYRPNELIGIALDGVPIVSSLVEIDVDGLTPDLSTGEIPLLLDQCGGIFNEVGTSNALGNNQQSMYNYRAMPACIVDSSDTVNKRKTLISDVHELLDAFQTYPQPSIVGYSLTGYPIYSPLNERGLLQDGLDSCNGRFDLSRDQDNDTYLTGATIEQPIAGYGYFTKPTFPYIIGCDGPGVYSVKELELPDKEMLKQATGSQLASCPGGYMKSNIYENGCIPCPAGKYSSNTYRNKRAVCKNDCPVGHYCPEGSISPIKCPGGRYGASRNLQTSFCSGQCSAGYYCPPGSTSANPNPCGNESYYCPIGSSDRLRVIPGYYSTSETKVSVGIFDGVPGSSVFNKEFSNDYRTRTNQVICPIGHYCVNGIKYPCPEGYFGSTTGLISPLCEVEGAASAISFQSTSGSFTNSTCPVGFYCPKASVSPIICPAGRYGNTVGLGTRDCSGACKKGFWCPAGSTSSTENACPAGRYGDADGLKTIECNANCEILVNTDVMGPTTLTATSLILPSEDSIVISHALYCIPKQCAPGYYCPPASTSATMHDCGMNASVYCPVGSYIPTRVSTGYYTVGSTGSGLPVISYPNRMQVSDDVKNRAAQVQCEPGYYCIDGVRYICPRGHYGGVSGLSSETCSGECEEGYYCEEGSTSPRQFSCSDSSVYCPRGSYEPTTVPNGYYSIGRNDSTMATRSAIVHCPPGNFCMKGIIRPCEPGRYSTSGSDSAECDGLCSPGYYCPSESTSATEIGCPAGRYGSRPGMFRSDCTGVCSAGYYCPLHSTSPTQNECGHDDVYCPTGSGAPIPVSVDHYTTGGTPQTRTNQAHCSTSQTSGTPPNGIVRVNKCPTTTL